MHVNATRYARRPQICDGPLYPWPGIGMCEVFPSASRSTRILQNKRVCVKFLFRGMGQGRWGGAQTPEFLEGCHYCSAQPLDNANTPYSEAGWREARATAPLTKIRRNSKLFAHPIAIYPARNEPGYISRESTKRIYICVCIYARVYVYTRELSIIHGSHDRWPVGIYDTRYVNWFVIAWRCERIIRTI